ncbi:MAG: hypothetical protein KUG79_20190 [Pseudomonadales bacterium]|nr:hypothetical protein [Pseudomonadales bacterium]
MIPINDDGNQPVLNVNSGGSPVQKPQRLPDLELVGYLQRWCVTERSRRGNQYLHHIMAADEPVMHDHPWDFKSTILAGGYTEMTPAGEVIYRQGDVVEKSATDLHYIAAVLPNTWSMILTGESVRDWGFLLDDEWVSHNDYQGARMDAIFRNGYGEYN